MHPKWLSWDNMLRQQCLTWQTKVPWAMPGKNAIDNDWIFQIAVDEEWSASYLIEWR